MEFAIHVKSQTASRVQPVILLLVQTVPLVTISIRPQILAVTFAHLRAPVVVPLGFAHLVKLGMFCHPQSV